MKKAIVQVADTGPLDSLELMLRSAGYQCYLPSPLLKKELRDIGCDTVLDIHDLVKGMGYELPAMRFPSADLADMDDCDLFVDIKAQRSYDKLCQRWPRLHNRTLWYRINGGQPEHVIKADGYDCGDEANPPCPVLTPNLWYRDVPHSYACWPPFVRFDDYRSQYRRPAQHFETPVCLLHNARGWGYQDLIKEAMPKLGIRCYGDGSPSGLVNHKEVPSMLSRAIAMVHFKSSDAPGYALYEALAAACPVIVPRRLIWRNRMEELFIDGETCLVFDRETHDSLSQEDVRQCMIEINAALHRLNRPEENKRIGENGYRQLQKLMWTDVEGFSEFMRRYFP